MGLRFQVLFHSPRRGSFRLSLTVLLRYRSYLVFSLGSWSTRIPAGFLVPRRTQDTTTLRLSFRIRGFHPLWPAFPKPFSYDKRKDIVVLQPLTTQFFRLSLINQYTIRKIEWSDLGSSGFARRYSRNHFCFLFPGYLDGSVPPVPLPQPIYSTADNRLAPAGLPHSAIDGSRDVCSSPSLFAACHGLPRLDTPRHPP